MNYYEVLVASHRYHSDKALTYSFEDMLEPGRVVSVPLQSGNTLGVIVDKVAKPAFKTKTVLRALPDNITVPAELIDLAWWLKDYYPSGMGQIMTMLLPSSLLKESRKAATANEIGDIEIQHVLTEEQETAVKTILSSKERMHLLHGETGSGKTRVYLELIQNMLADKLSSIILTPEIGLTPQLVASAEAAFPGTIVLLHSNLTPAQRRDRWLQIAASTTPLVIIGPRSALFAPVNDVGLIILDEAHDSAYKQEQAPYYVASRAAAKLAEFHNAKVVLGSATPLISDFYAFEQKKLPIHRMTSLATAGTHTSNTEIINLRDREQFTRSSWLSLKMINAIEKTLENQTLSLIFLNRRGSARLVLCQSCGWQAACPRCDLPLTYHGDKHVMRCHTCGFSSETPASCPACKSTDIVFRSIGTKALVAEIEKLFPKARVMRFDSDNTKEESLESRFNKVRSGEADIIVGTQLLAKGLDLPRFGLGGVVLADTGMYFPDYTAEERTYQLISQVIGRADRGHRDTIVTLQSYHPDNATLLQAIDRNYGDFYKSQLAERQNFGFPPFRYILKLRVERASSPAAEKAAGLLATKIKELGLKVEISNPSPAFIEKVHNRYRWQLIIKSVDRQLLVSIIRQLPANTGYDIDPTNLL